MIEPAAGTSVRLEIRRLMLDGFRLHPRQSVEVRRAVETELGALLSTGALPARLGSGGSMRRAPGKVPVIESWTDARDLGRQVAQAVYEGMQR